MKLENKDLNYKLGLLKLAMELDNVSLACKILGYSRPTYYRYKKAYLEGGEGCIPQEAQSQESSISTYSGSGIILVFGAS